MVRNKEQRGENVTKERQERNRRNSERLSEIIVWSIQNHDLWLRLCFGDTDQGIHTHDLNAIIDQCLHREFMEIYYIVLTQVAHVVEIGADWGRLKQFLEVCVDENLTLDMDRIEKAIKQTQEKAGRFEDTL